MAAIIRLADRNPTDHERVEAALREAESDAFALAKIDGSGLQVYKDPACENIDPEKFDAQYGAWMSGRARCLTCAHEWAGVAPRGIGTLKCPSCMTFHGAFVGAVTRSGEDHYQCACGNQMFCLTAKRVYCAHCGKDHKPWG